MRLHIYISLLLGSLITLTAAWGKDDQEIFRLKAELEASEGPEVTFYDFLGISNTATQQEIEKAFKKKSLRLHPDKVKQRFIASRSTGKPKAGKSKGKKKPGVHVSRGPSASQIEAAAKEATARYSRLGVVNNILKGPGRERYDHFLKNGFPRWKGTGYYYARFRPGLGSVLVGLFVFGGGAAHYGALYLGWKRQREFVSRYIRHARRMAWGNDLGIKGIDGIGTSATAAGSATRGNIGLDDGREDSGMVGLNRKQRRQYEKDSKKKGGAKENGSSNVATPPASETPPAGPQGGRKKVIAENGKVLIVDSTGSVFLEEENEDGETEVFLLDINEIPPPTIRQTALVRFPVWIWRKSVGAVFRKKEDSSENEVEYYDESSEEEVKSKGNARRRAKRNGKAR